MFYYYLFYGIYTNKCSKNVLLPKPKVNAGIKGKEGEINLLWKNCPINLDSILGGQKVKLVQANCLKEKKSHVWQEQWRNYSFT